MLSEGTSVHVKPYYSSQLTAESPRQGIKLETARTAFVQGGPILDAKTGPAGLNLAGQNRSGRTSFTRTDFSVTGVATGPILSITKALAVHNTDLVFEEDLSTAP